MTVEEWKRKNPPIQRKPRTNVNRIRSMTDEELAEWLAAHNERNAVCPNFGAYNCQANCIQCWLAWLKQKEEER